MRPLDDQYLEWLYAQIASINAPRGSQTYWTFTKQLFHKEFVWFVPNDDNRVEDGKYLRHDFLNKTGSEYMDEDWMGIGCSMMEMLVALSRRLAFESDGMVSDWFWKLISNMGFETYDVTDARYPPSTERKVDKALDRVIFRTYNYDGSGGGLFPLRLAEQDQRKVEIWYQLNAYLVEG